MGLCGTSFEFYPDCHNTAQAINFIVQNAETLNLVK